MNFLRLLLFTGVMSALTGCSDNNSTQEPASPSPMLPTPVTVSEVLYETITEWQEFTGRLEAPQTVELRPRVSGYINKVSFTEGSMVKKGQVLFEIDPRPFQAEVNRLQAELKSVQARAKLARSDLARAQSLRKQKAIAIEQVESRSADLEQALANVESTTAELASEKLNLSFTRVIAPITGRVSRALVTTGNYVTAGQSELTSLVSVDEMYAYFDADEQTFLSYQAQPDEVASRKVLMKLANETEYKYQGTINFIDNQVNPQTGTIRFRAVFSNNDSRFTPGLFVRLKVGGSRQYKAILIDDKAIATDLSNKFVLVLAQDDILEYRPVLPGHRYAGLRVIQEGLKPGDTIVTRGLQRVFPGTKVAPEIQPMAGPEVMRLLNTTRQYLSPVIGMPGNKPGPALFPLTRNLSAGTADPGRTDQPISLMFL